MEKNQFKVVVRIRPTEGEVVKTVGTNLVIFNPPHNRDNHISTHTLASTPGSKRYNDIAYAFDNVFDKEASQIEVYKHTARELVGHVLGGYNATCFAYGTTGSGKVLFCVCVFSFFLCVLVCVFVLFLFGVCGVGLFCFSLF